MPKLHINKLTDFFFYVFLLTFLALPFYAFYSLVNTSVSNNKIPEVFVASTEGVSLSVYPEKSSYAPNQEATFFVEAKAMQANTNVNSLTLAVFIPNTLTFPKTGSDSSVGITKLISDTFLVEYKSIEPFRDTTYNQVVLSLVKQPGSTFSVSTTGTKLISFKATASAVGNYEIKFRDIEPKNNIVDASGVELFNGTATGSTFVVSNTPTPVVTPTTVVPTPTPTVVVPTPTPTVAVTPTPSPTVNPTSVKGINLTVALQGRTGSTAVKGNSLPSVFVGVWRPSTNTMLASTVTTTSTLGVAANLNTLLSGNGSSYTLQSSDVIIVKPESYLSKTFTVGSLSQSANNLVVPSETYTAGDVSVAVGSFDTVNALDYTFSWAYYGSGQKVYPYYIDYTGDGVVTIFDLSFFSTNVGKSGATVTNPEMQKQMENLLRSNLYKVIQVTN